ncbi:MAG: methyltransferase domain-containing protein [Gemmatimonadaceae bacterium]
MNDSVRKSTGENETELAGIDVSTAYDRWSAQYDRDRNPTRDLDARILRQSTKLVISGQRVLEFGCGTGKNTEYLAQRARELTAMDFSAGMLSVAKQRVPQSHVRFVQHDVREHWPLSDNSVDVVIGNLVLEHVEQLAPVYAEAARVLCDGGQLYLCELHPYRQWRGGQAHFTEQSSGETVQVSAYVHSVGDYVNAGINQHFQLAEIGEWLEEDAAAGAFPRLLSLLFTRAARL